MADSKRYYWLKLYKDFFQSKRIKKLRRLAGGDTYTIIYLKMQLLALTTGGELIFTGLENSFAEELALDIDESADNVAVTLEYLKSCELLITQDNIHFYLPYVEENTGSETASAQRVRDFRQLKKALHCNNDVTNLKQVGNAEIEIEKEIDILTNVNISKSTHVDYQGIANSWNEICVSFPKVTSLSEARKKAINARLKTYTVDDLIKAFNLAEESDFLKGKNDRNWSANFDWIIKDTNLAKVLDGNYKNKTKGEMTNENTTSYQGFDFSKFG